MSPLMRNEKKLKLERGEQNRRTVGMRINHFLTNKHCLSHPVKHVQEGIGVTTGAPEAAAFLMQGPWPGCHLLTLLSISLLDWMQVAQFKG